jgi:hypothetical protein
VLPRLTGRQVLRNLAVLLLLGALNLVFLAALAYLGRRSKVRPGVGSGAARRYFVPAHLNDMKRFRSNAVLLLLGALNLVFLAALAYLERRSKVWPTADSCTVFVCGTKSRNLVFLAALAYLGRRSKVRPGVGSGAARRYLVPAHLKDMKLSR